MKLHLPSVLASIGVVALVALLTSQGGPLVTGTIRIQYVPDPRTLVNFGGNTPYVVPAGKQFVLTALGTAGSFGGSTVEVRLRRNGADAARVLIPSASTMVEGNGSMVAVPLGFSAQAGDSLQLDSAPDRAWGFLVNQ